MFTLPALSRRTILFLRVTVTLLLPQIVSAQCAGISEQGRWRNLDKNGEPGYIDVKMGGGCGDTAPNGDEGQSRIYYTMRVWVRQSTGKYYGRASVRATFRAWNGHKWLEGNVPVGGYLDHMWLRVENRNGQQQLHVFIKHESLDSKPSSQSEYWYSKSS